MVCIQRQHWSIQVVITFCCRDHPLCNTSKYNIRSVFRFRCTEHLLDSFPFSSYSAGFDRFSCRHCLADRYHRRQAQPSQHQLLGVGEYVRTYVRRRGVRRSSVVPISNVFMRAMCLDDRRRALRFPTRSVSANAFLMTRGCPRGHPTLGAEREAGLFCSV